ncbi:2-amino-4-hydroxy-6-hydroxymethyldihydropteridine diphosphokinase [SAR86 cluster bacterium]|jgi:2-amino-4-hydroxy-6-hydroxymethyldihydropteridine diphosphokinase|nr:2-amino-4-hydroxy-6-hydroxymethyldihydropteridine diphosphokinase [SAR86 cluster bacterium]URQ72089.1 2-amino-4-hydroxy-6-hydroxymethyldihydropteridine diphosphokinase [SAR86 cluster bacterium]GIS26079.1 MAG: 2-amino-4-hydroxy-6-hydroxymethyldihydropteridine diphosphokinase [Gammaproteobacteria bacterium]|tara:strand:- start:928 stop:1311 length:384 start_codon:yes stop_codon:yes gene_type:complete
MIFYLSIGSNIEPEKNISFAIKKLNELLEDLIQSSIIISKAEGFIGDDFHNLVVSGRSNLTFNEMNKQLKAIEDLADRNRDVPKFSSRTLDIDITLITDKNQKIVFESDEIEKYEFVSKPLSELINL